MTKEELIELSDEASAQLVAPPSDAPDVCPMCRSWRPTVGPICPNCAQAESDLSFHCGCVIPISLYRKPSLLRDWLTLYKSGDKDEHLEYRRYIGAIVARFFLEHGEALRRTVGGYDAICAVPSAKRTGRHPLAQVFDDYVRPSNGPREDLLGKGPGEVGHRIMSDDAFVVLRPVVGFRVLLFDDVYTTGAAAQSAASALMLAGAEVPTIVVIARRLNLEYDPAVEAIWTRQASEPFSFSRRPFWATDQAS